MSEINEATVRAEFHREVNLIATGRIVAVDANGSVREFAEIPGPSRMIENDFLVQLFEFGAHAKKRAASRRISTMRSISAVVL